MKSAKNEMITRFSGYRIIEHHLNAVVFVVLAVTGLSQKFHNAAFSQWLILAMGGVDAVRLIHHVAGVLFTVLVAVHVTQASVGVLFKKWQPSMIITVKDYQDAIANILFYFGLRAHPARCDRYDYRQKFEYWGVVVGGFLMIATGFVLWFPVISTHLLPGEIIPAAKAAHTNEAMLAFLVIVVWHIYNSIFSPEVFPLDTSIFTGKISRERMLHEHPMELAAMEGVSVEELLEEAKTVHSHAPGGPHKGHVQI
jgi:formate dehydrogenase subunit gamma